MMISTLRIRHHLQGVKQVQPKTKKQALQVRKNVDSVDDLDDSLAENGKRETCTSRKSGSSNRNFF